MRVNYHHPIIFRRSIVRKGCGIVNKLINSLPFELHLPGYNYCGPGTKLEKRLARGDRGINLLDEACKTHDIAYSKTTNLQERHAADNLLAQAALERYRAKDANFGEKAAALGVTGAMKAKVKLGMGHKRGRKQKGITFKQALKNARRLNDASHFKRVRKSSIPRIIPIPKKSGGFLPLLFAGLSALGALAGGAAGIAGAVNKAKAAQKNLEETQRHNQEMEKIAVGKGMFLAPYKKGLGLYLKPYSKNY